MSLRIYLFGPFELLRDGQPLAGPGWRSRQTRTILKVLLTRRGSVVPVEQFLELLWPNEEPESARRHLHVRISQLRRVLAPAQKRDDGYLLTAGGGYTFTCRAGCWLDVDVFAHQVERGRRAQESGDLLEAVTAYETARTLYRGDYLEEDLYESWAAGERERLRELYLTVLTELAECYAQQGRYRRALGVCEQILQDDPLREAVYLHQMLYHYYAGEQAQALRTYARCRQLLATELGVEPLPSTRALAAKMQAGTLWNDRAAPRYPPPAYEGRLFAVPYSLGRPPFTGREREYAWLVERWQDPGVSVLLLAGEPGIGKSRLAQEFLGYARDQGATVLAATAAPAEDRPYAPLRAALRAYPHLWSGLETALSTPELALLGHLFPEVYGRFALESVADHDLLWQDADARLRLRHTLLKLVERQLPAATLLFIDDAHHLDGASAAMLPGLSRHCTVLLGYRAEETPPDHPLPRGLQPLQRRQKVAALTLAPLPPEATTRLLQELAGPGLPPLLRETARRAGGSPLFLLALLQHLFEEGALYVGAEGAWTAVREDGVSLPPTIWEAIARRLRRLDGARRRVFDAAAVAGDRLSFALLEAVSGLAEGPLLEAIDKLLALGLLLEPRTPGRQELSFSHDSYREVGYELLPELRRRHLHRQVAAFVERRSGQDPGVAAVLAHHYRRGEQWPEAVRAARRAGEHALRLYASEEAAVHFAHCLDWAQANDVPLPQAERALLHFFRGEALRRRGDYDGALAHLEEAQKMGSGEVRQIAAFRRASVAAIRGEGLRAFRRLAPVLEKELAGSGETWALALLRWEQAYTAAMRGEAAAARAAYTKGWQIARRLRREGKVPAPWVLGRAYTALARSYELWGEGTRALRYARRALAAEQRGGDGNGIGAATFVCGLAHFGLGNWEQARSAFRRQLTLSAKAQDPRSAGDARYYLGVIACFRGRTALAGAHARRIVAQAQETADIFRLSLGQSLQAQIQLAAGPEAKVAEQVAAIHHQQEQLALALEAGFFALRANVLLAESELAQGLSERSLETTTRGLALALRARARWEVIPLLRVRGLALAAADAEAGLEALDEAVLLGRRSGCRYQLARAQVARGRIYWQLGQAEAAQAEWAHARRLFALLDARPQLAALARLPQGRPQSMGAGA